MEGEKIADYYGGTGRLYRGGQIWIVQLTRLFALRLRSASHFLQVRGASHFLGTIHPFPFEELTLHFALLLSKYNSSK